MRVYRVTRSCAPACIASYLVAQGFFGPCIGTPSLKTPKPSTRDVETAIRAGVFLDQSIAMQETQFRKTRMFRNALVRAQH